MWDDSSLWFWFASPRWLPKLSIFPCIWWPPACPLWKSASSDFSLHFLLLSCIRSLYISEISPVSVIWFVNIFSHLVGWFHLLCRSLTVWCSPTYLFLLLLFMSHSKKHLQDVYQGAYHLFPSRNFTISGLTLKLFWYKNVVHGPPAQWLSFPWNFQEYLF